MHGPSKPSPTGRYLDLYAKLGVSPNASTDAIRLAYQVLAEAYCPDGAYTDDAMHQAFSEIQNAAEILGHPRTRKLYDQGYIDSAGHLTEAGLARRRRVRIIGLSGGLIAAASAAVLIFGFWPSSKPDNGGGVQTTALQEPVIRSQAKVTPPPPPPAAVNPTPEPKAAAETPAPSASQDPKPAQPPPQEQPSQTAPQPSDSGYLPAPASRQSPEQAPPKYSSPAENRHDGYAQQLERRKRQELTEQEQPSGMWDTDIWFPRRRYNEDDRSRPASRSASCLACLADGGDCSGICP